MPADAEQPDRHEPGGHDGPKQFSDAATALRLQGEQADQDGRRERHDVGRDVGRGNL